MAQAPCDQDVRFHGCVLVAEDVKTNQILIKLILERVGLDVVLVENGNQAVVEATRNPYDSDSDGCADAREERARGDAGAARPRAGDADCRPDRPRDERGSGRLPERRLR